MSEELKSCPFCGGEAYASAIKALGVFSVRCGECVCSTGHYANDEVGKKNSITAWNTRATDASITSLEEENARLKEEIRRQKARAEDHFRNAKQLADKVAALSIRGEG